MQLITVISGYKLNSLKQADGRQSSKLVNIQYKYGAARAFRVFVSIESFNLLYVDVLIDFSCN